MRHNYIGSYGLFLNEFTLVFDDVDVLTDNIDECKKVLSQLFPSKRVEYFLAEEEMLALLEPDHLTNAELLTLKLSHLSWNINWPKHAKQAVELLSAGVKPDEELYKSLYSYWQRRNTKKKCNLMKSNDQFFKNGIKYQYVHDDLHRSIMYYNQPLFELCKPDLDSAYLSERLFNRLTIQDRLRLAEEEIYVTALERFLIPGDFKENPEITVRKAIMQLTTSMTKGWFCRHILFNLDKLWSPQIDYVAKFKAALAVGKVRDAIRI